MRLKEIGLVTPRLISALGHAAIFVGMLLGLSSCTSSGTDSLSSAQSTSTAAVGTQSGDLRVVNALPLPSSGGGPTQIKVAANDLLKIDVFQVPDLNRSVRVEPSGNISMPLIGQIKAADLTIPELEIQLEKRYGASYLQNPEITVFLEESFGQRITVDGAVAKPGIYQVSAQTTLLQAVAEAGGFTKLADEKKVFVFREIGGQKLVANYSIKDIRLGKKQNPKLVGGDVVVAFQSDAKIAADNLRQALGIASSATRVISPL